MKKSIIKVMFSLLFIGSVISCASSTDTLSETSNDSNPSTSTDTTTSTDTETSSTVEDILVEEIHITADKEVFAPNEINYSVTVLPGDATNKEFAITFSDENLISQHGDKIYAKTKGKLKITAVSLENSDFTASCDVDIYDQQQELDSIEYINKLGEDAYMKDIVSTEELSSFKAYKAGIDENKKKNEVLYPTPVGDDVLVYNASDHGITTSNTTNNAEKLTYLLNELKTVEGTKVVQFENGTYKFEQKISIAYLNNTYLNGGESTKFVYSGFLSYFEFKVCENVHLNNITFDLDPSPTITGRIAAVDESNSSQKVITVEVPKTFDLSKPQYASWATRMCGSYAEYKFDETYQTYVPNLTGNLFYSNGVASGAKGILNMVVRKEGDKQYLDVTLSTSFGACAYKTPQLNTIVAIGFTVYDIFGFLYYDCVDMYMENITAYVTPGMGLRTDEGKNLYLNRVNFVRDNTTSRLLTCTADIIHTCALEGELVITNCELEGSHDDALNIKSFYTKIDSIQGKVVDVKQTQSEAVIKFDVGDTVEVYDSSNFERKNTFTVEAVGRVGNGFTLTLDKNISRNYLGLLMGNATKATKMTLSNSLISNKRNRGILLQARSSIIDNCTFQNVVMGAVQVLGVDDVFKEALMPSDITVRNTMFLQCNDALSVFCYGSTGNAVAGTINNVNISNNFFYNNIGRDVWLKGCGNVEMYDNLFCSRNKSYTVSINTSKDLNISNNTVVQPQFASGYVFITSSTDVTNITKENNLLKTLTF